MHLSYLPRTLHLTTFRLAIILRTLGFPAVPLHGQLSQSQRLGALGKFKSGGRKVLVATDVASRYVTNPGVFLLYATDILYLEVSTFPPSMS